MDSIDLKSVVTQCNLFSGLDDSALDIIILRGRITLFSRGETIYMKAEDANGFFCVIISGRVGIIAESGQVVRGMGSGDVIGEIGAISPQHKRTLTVEVIKPTEVLEWHVEDIKDLVPDFMKKLKALAWKNISNYMDE